MELALWMFPVLLLLLLIGIPVAYSLFTVSLVFGILRFGDKAIFQFVSKVQDVAGNYILAAVPLFVFMGCMLERAGIAERLFQAFHLWTRKHPEVWQLAVFCWALYLPLPVASLVQQKQ